jgi:hypothetical protein
MPERSDPRFHDTVRAITDLLDPRHSARRSGGSLMLSVREVATRMAEAGWRPPAQNAPTITDPKITVEDHIVRAQVVDARHVPAVAAPFPDL